MKTIAIFTVVAASFFTQVNSQTVTASMTANSHNSYAGIAAQFHLTDLKADGQQILGGEGYLFCADLVGKSLDEDSQTYPRLTSTLTLGTMEQMQVWNRYSNTQDEPLTRAMAHWVVDTYYESHFTNPVNDKSERQYAFQNVLWEVFGDAGTADGLDFGSGNINRSKFSPSGSAPSPTLWSYMSDMLVAANASGINSSYVPKFKFSVALDSRETHQDYLLLAANPSLMTVPEPSSSALIAIGLSLAFFRKKRSC